MSFINKVRAAFEDKHHRDEEFDFHLCKQIHLNVAKGMSPDEARRQALIAFGGIRNN